LAQEIRKKLVLIDNVRYFQTSERQILKKETGADPGKEASNEVLFRIDVPANRYDLLCLEGLAQAILIFQGR